MEPKKRVIQQFSLCSSTHYNQPSKVDFIELCSKWFLIVKTPIEHKCLLNTAYTRRQLNILQQDCQILFSHQNESMALIVKTSLKYVNEVAQCRDPARGVFSHNLFFIAGSLSQKILVVRVFCHKIWQRMGARMVAMQHFIIRILLKGFTISLHCIKPSAIPTSLLGALKWYNSPYAPRFYILYTLSKYVS